MRLVFAALIVAAGARVTARAAEPSAAALEFFENKVRPLLVENCLGCHGEKKQEAGLRLDAREAVFKGSDTGPVLTPGEPEKSKLIRAIRYREDLRMPPRGRLPEAAIQTFVEWVKLGAPFPSGATVAKTLDPRFLWGYQPLQNAAVPRSTRPAASEIDRFLEVKLGEKGLGLSPIADPRSLVRRAYYDLTGLAPTADEVEAFVADAKARPQAAFAALIDRLLASPHYGEAQARHWLDLARYADTKGYVFVEDRNYPFAYTYRDWVIRAFNEDLPYDRFVQLQIAADRMQNIDPRDLAAMGFLTVGRRFLNNNHDIIDDRLDVTCRTFMGLTIGCARCHDHKFDPIPTRDYYSLYGVFASSVEPPELPLLGPVERTPEVMAFENQLQKLFAEHKALEQKLIASQIEKLKSPEVISAYLLAVRDLKDRPGDKVQAYLREKDLNPMLFGRWKAYLAEQQKDNPALYRPFEKLAALAEPEFAIRAPDLLAEFNQSTASGKKVPERLLKSLQGLKPKTFKEITDIYGKLISVDAMGAGLGSNSPLNISEADGEKLLRRDDRNKLREAVKKIEAFKASSPAAPPRAMVLNDAPAAFEPYVFLRGNPDNHGPKVPRQFLQVLSGPERKPFKNGSGRLELAQAIASADNPLTARVMVNRIWSVHFGQGLVRTPSDFGVRSDLPVHPELLDYLARQFIVSGWSIKKMHRLIMLSQAYQQAAEVTADLERLDPENRLFSRMNRRRLDFEALRDQMLQAAGQLDEKIGGRPVELFKEPYPRRRTLYGFIDRQNLPGTFRAFDFASPDQHSPQRFVTTVPQQALFLMNSPFVMEQARQLVKRPEIIAKNGTEPRAAAIIRIVYQRAATPEEIMLARRFVDAATQSPAGQAADTSFGPWEQLAQTLLLSNEFAFVE